MPIVQIVRRLPLAHTTGYSYPELTGQIQYLFTIADAAVGHEVELINTFPLPIPKELYKPRYSILILILFSLLYHFSLFELPRISV